MPDTIKTTLKEEYNRLKKVVEKIINPRNQPLPQLLLQRAGIRKILEILIPVKFLYTWSTNREEALYPKGFIVFNLCRNKIEGY